VTFTRAGLLVVEIAKRKIGDSSPLQGMQRAHNAPSVTYMLRLWQERLRKQHRITTLKISTNTSDAVRFALGISCGPVIHIYRNP